MALYSKSASFSRKLFPSGKTSPPLLNYIIKTILSDVELREEYDATKYSSIK